MFFVHTMHIHCWCV